MARINKEQIVTNALREEGLKIVGSDKSTSTEKMHWSKLLFDMQDVTKQELTVQVKQGEDAREAAETALKTAQTALDAANAKVAELEPLAAQLPDMTAQYTELKANFDARVAEMREELVAESQRHAWAAARSENAAKETLKTAQAEFGARGQQILLDFVQKLVEQFNIPEPDPATLPNGISPLILTCWGHSHIKSQLLLSFAKSFPEPNEAFKNTLLRVLRARLPLYEGTPQSDPIPDIDVKQAVLTAMAVKWNVLTEIQKRIDDEQVMRQANFLREHHAMMQAQSNDAALRGEGRTPIGEAEPVSITGYTGPHDPNCCCGRPGCNPLPAHLRAFEIEESL